MDKKKLLLNVSLGSSKRFDKIIQDMKLRKYLVESIFRVGIVNLK